MNPAVHFELPADNLKRAKSFYESVFGWEITPKHSHLSGRRIEQEVIPQIIIWVQDIDMTASKIEKAGGKILEPKKKIGDSMWYGKAVDSEGNLLRLGQDVHY